MRSSGAYFDAAMSPAYCGHSPSAVVYGPRDSIQRARASELSFGSKNGPRCKVSGMLRSPCSFAAAVSESPSLAGLALYPLSQAMSTCSEPRRCFSSSNQ